MNKTFPDLSKFTLYEKRTDPVIDGVKYPIFEVAFYRRKVGKETESIGVYSHNGQEIFAAWGLLSSAHCDFHALSDGKCGWRSARLGCPDMKKIVASISGVNI
jgi:hypothetical protein